MISPGSDARLPYKRLAVLLLFALLFAWTPSARAYSPAAESALPVSSMGKEEADQIEEEMGRVRDPALATWVEEVGARLVRAGGGNPRDYHFRIVSAEDVNAFAIPGGYVYVTMGLLRFVDSEEELAAVMGHELSHLSRRHGEKQMQRNFVIALALTLLRSHLSDTLSLLGDLGGNLYSLKHSRSDEAEADSLGIRKAAAAGYEPEAMVDFLRKLGEKEKHKPSRLEVYFLTHPPTNERLARAAKAPEVDPGNLIVRRAAAAGLADRGLYGQAALLYQEIMARRPDDASLHLAAADCWQHLGRLDLAREERARARSLGARVQEPPAPPPLDEDATVAARAAIVAASDEIVRTHDTLRADRARRITAVGDVRRALDTSKRRFRSMAIAVDQAGATLTSTDIARQEQIYRIALAAANVERAVDRVEGIADIGGSFPDDLAKYAAALNSQLARPTVDLRVIATAHDLAPIATRALADLDAALGACREVLKLADNATLACESAARDLGDVPFLSGTFALARLSQIDSRIRAATSEANTAVSRAESAGARADAADARRRVAELDLTGERTPPRQRPAAYALLARHFGVPDTQSLALAQNAAPYGQSAASLLLGLAVRVSAPARSAADGSTPAPEAIKPVTLDEAINRKMPLGPLNASLRLLALDLSRENGAAAKR